MMRTNVEERTSILLKGAWFETSFHNNRLFIYSNNTTCFLKILLESKSEHFITGKFLRYTGDRQKGSAHVFKSVGSWAAELHRALPVLCGFPAGGRPGQHSVLRGLEGIRSCPYQVTLPSQITPCSLLLSFPSLSFFLLWFSRVITGWDFCHTHRSQTMLCEPSHLGELIETVGSGSLIPDILNYVREPAFPGFPPCDTEPTSLAWVLLTCKEQC